MNIICAFKEIQFIECFIFFTFCNLLINNKIDLFKQLLFIIFISILNEVILNFQYCSNKTIIGLNTTLYVIFLYVLWCFILFKKKTKFNNIIIFCYILFSIINLFYIESWKIFNFNVFIVGALIYVISFLKICYFNLSKENFAFFQSNYFMLIFSPVLFFLGMSLMFSFRNKPLLSTNVFGIQLYTLVNYTVNIIYYALINLYIYKERKQKNA